MQLFPVQACIRLPILNFLCASPALGWAPLPSSPLVAKWHPGIGRELRRAPSCLSLRGGGGAGGKVLSLPFEQVDAFASRPFTGNPAAVVLMKDGQWLSDEMLLAIAEENNLSETSFIRYQPKDSGYKYSYDLRWFTPTVEINLCGHATLAAAASLFASGVDTEVLKFQTLSGELTVSRKGGRLQMELPAWPQAPKTALIEQVGKCVGVTPIEFHWAEGCRDGMAVFESAQQIKDLVPDLAKIRDLPCGGLICTAQGPAADGPCDIVYRFFAPRLGIDEDPACGSAQCSLVPYWAEKLGKVSLFSIQLSKRRAEIYGELQQLEGVEKKILVSGTAVTVIKGEIMVPVD